MKPKIILCIDKIAVHQPDLIGLQEENLLAQDWISIQTDALDVREFLKRTQDIREIWVISCMGVEPINLAAALKKDQSNIPVVLVSPEKTGSLKSRAQTAGLDCILSESEFLQRYYSYKKKALIPDDRFTVMHGSNNRGISEEKSQEVIQKRKELISPSSKESKKPALVIPVLSACGGSGKSTVSVLLACLAKQKGYRTLLFDADLQFGDANFLMGVQEPITLDEILINPASFSKIRAHETMPTVLGAPRDLEQSEIANSELVAILGHCAQHFDVVVVNTGSFWAGQHVTLLERASYALFLLDQRASSIRDCKHALDYCSRCAVAAQPIRFMLNRCSRASLFSSIDVSCGLGGVPVAELLDGGKAVSELLGAGQPLDLLESKNPLYTSLEQAVTEFLPSKVSGRDELAPNATRQLGKRFLFGRKRGVACL